MKLAMRTRSEPWRREQSRRVSDLMLLRNSRETSNIGRNYYNMDSRKVILSFFISSVRMLNIHCTFESYQVSSFWYEKGILRRESWSMWLQTFFGVKCGDNWQHRYERMTHALTILRIYDNLTLLPLLLSLFTLLLL